MLVPEAIAAFKAHLKSKERSPETIRGYNQLLQDFNRYLESELNGQVYLEEVELAHLEGYLVYRKEQGDLPISRNRALYILRSFYSFLYKRDLVERDISQKLEPIKVQSKERLHLVAEEVEQLLAAIDRPLIKVIATTLAYTGLRVTELCTLTLDTVDLEHGFLHVTGKGNKQRIVPINSTLQAVLQDYIEDIRPQVDSDRFFATKKTGKISPAYINRCLEETTEKLGWKKHVTAHILRHSFASELVRKQAPLPAVQNLLGHSDLRVTSRYIHQNLNDLKDAVDLI